MVPSEACSTPSAPRSAVAMMVLVPLLDVHLDDVAVEEVGRQQAVLAASSTSVTPLMTSSLRDGSNTLVIWPSMVMR